MMKNESKVLNLRRVSLILLLLIITSLALTTVSASDSDTAVTASDNDEAVTASNSDTAVTASDSDTTVTASDINEAITASDVNGMDSDKIEISDSDLEKGTIANSNQENNAIANSNQENNAITNSKQNIAITTSDIEDTTKMKSESDNSLGIYDYFGKYVAKNGSDITGDGSYENPYLSIQKALDTVDDGETVYIGTGEYNLSSPLSINKNMTIRSHDGEVILNGQGRSRIFSLTKDNTLNLKELTFINGYGTNGGVADLSNFDKGNGKLEIDACKFINNTATNGGVFYFVTTQTESGTSTMEILNSEFINNSASKDGGAIYSISSNEASHLISNSYFLNNTAETGGAVYCMGMIAFDVYYSVLINNTNIPYYATIHREGKIIKDSYWGTNDPTVFEDKIGNVKLQSWVKIAIISEEDTITSDETSLLTIKYQNNNNEDYGNNIQLHELSAYLESEDGYLSISEGVLSTTGFTSLFSPGKTGNATITANIFGDYTVSKTIEVVPAPYYASANAEEGSGDGSLNNPYSLKDAIAIANSDSKESVIELLDGYYQIPEALTINSNLTIRPYKTGNVSLNGNNRNGIFIISNSTVLIANLSFENASSDKGGAISITNSSNVTIISSIIKNNSADYGGAIYVANNSHLNISYSQILNNRELTKGNISYGSGIYNEGSGEIIADNNWWGSNSNPIANISEINYNSINISSYFIANINHYRSVLRNNWNDTILVQLSNNDGSPISADANIKNIEVSFATNTGTLSIENGNLTRENNYTLSSVISGINEDAEVSVNVDNQAETINYQFEIPKSVIYIATDGDDVKGDGSESNPYKTLYRAFIIANESGTQIYMKSGTYDYLSYIGINNIIVTISSYNGDVTIDRNSNFDVLKIYENANLTLNNIKFANGYNIYASDSALHNNGILIIKNCSFTNGTGGCYGQYIDNKGYLEIYDSNFTDTKTVSENHSNAAIITANGYTYIYNCRFENNGFISNETRESVPETGSTIITTGEQGENSLRNTRGTVIVENSIFDGNYKTVSMTYDGGNTSFINCTISNTLDKIAINTDEGIDIKLNILNCSFINNTAGAIGILKPDNPKVNYLYVANSSFTNNHGERGGAIYTIRSISEIINCSFSNNTAENGGAIYTESALTTILNNEFINNTASEKGGAIYRTGSENITIKENNFTNSSARIGGTIYSNGITALIDNYMFNSTAEDGTFIYNDNRIGNTYTIILDNKTFETTRGSTFEIYGKVVDDMLNPISGGSVAFTINGEDYIAELSNEIAVVRYSFEEAGTYHINGSYLNNRRFLYNSQDGTVIVSNSSGPSRILVNHTGDDNRDIQKAIDSAKSGDTIDLGSNYDYENINHLNITKSLEFTGNNVSISSGEDADCIFYLVPKSGENDYALLSEGPGSLLISNITFQTRSGDVIVKAKAENADYGYSDIAEILIIGNDFKLLNGANPKSVSILSIESENLFNPNNQIRINNNTLVSGMKTAEIILCEEVIEGVKATSLLTIDKVSMIDKEITVSLKDMNDEFISNEIINYTIIYDDEIITGFGLSDENGQIHLNNLTKNAEIIFSYLGSDIYKSSSIELNYTIEIAQKATKLIFSNMTTCCVLESRTGENFTGKLTDEEGNALAGKKVQIGFNGKIYERTTNQSGEFKLQVNLASAGGYTFAISFLGDKFYNASFGVAKITVEKNPTKLSGNAYTYKASAKTKSISINLKTQKGKVLANKSISISVNGKTYTAKTNSNGVATVNVSITSKKTYTYTAKFAGDSQCAASSTSSKITIN